MSKRLTEEELATWGSQPTSCVEARAASEIIDLRDYIKTRDILYDGLLDVNRTLEKSREWFRSENAELREVAEKWRNKKLVPCMAILSDGAEEKLDSLRADNAGLRVELATAQEILLQERELLTAENDKLKKKSVGLVEFLKNDTFSLVDRISSAIRTLENDDE